MADKKQEIINLLIDKLNEEFILQGHPDTGAFQESLRGEVVEEDGKEIINIYGLDYGIYISEGVEAANIPYTKRKRGQGKGGTSKYITGLKNWVKSKLGIADEREALSIAFAIAEKHSVEGMPVRNGKLGSGFIEEVREKYINDLNNKVLEYMNNKVKKNMKDNGDNN